LVGNKNRGRERTRTEELLCTLRRAEVLCSSQAGGGSLVPAAVQPRFRLVVAARGAPGPGVPAGCGRGSSSPVRAEAAPADAGHEWRRESRVGERDERLRVGELG